MRHITLSAYIVAQNAPQPCYVLLMFSKLSLVVFALCLLTSLAFTQQSDDAVKAVQNLEQYREGLIKLWMNDFGNLGRYREANYSEGRLLTAQYDKSKGILCYLR